MKNQHILTRLISVALVSTLLFCFVSCSSEPTRRENISDKMYEYGIAAVEIVDDYLDGRITIEDAYDKLDRNYDYQEMHIKSELKEYGKDTLYGTPVSQDSSIKLYTSLLSWELFQKKIGTGVDADIKEYRDKLANALWE